MLGFRWSASSALVGAVLAVGASCGSTPSTPRPGSEESGPVTVAAASSLTGAYTSIGHDFERAHPGAKVTFTFDSSATLERQIEQGAPVDAFASADVANMDKLAAAGLVAGHPVVFAGNRLVIVTKAGNPARVAGLRDLAEVGVVSLCAEDAPCGTFAAEALAKADVAISERSVTRGQNVKATLTAVTEGDAVAGIVYASDALAAGATVVTVAIPQDQNVVASYPAAVVEGARNAETARAFVAYLTGDEAQAVLRKDGFSPRRRR